MSLTNPKFPEISRISGKVETLSGLNVGLNYIPITILITFQSGNPVLTRALFHKGLQLISIVQLNGKPCIKKTCDQSQTFVKRGPGADQSTVSQRVTINRTIDINHTAQWKTIVLRKLAINRKPL